MKVDVKIFWSQQCAKNIQPKRPYLQLQSQFAFLEERYKAHSVAGRLKTSRNCETHNSKSIYKKKTQQNNLSPVLLITLWDNKHQNQRALKVCAKLQKIKCMIFKSTTCVNIVKGITRFGARLGELYKMYCFNIYIYQKHFCLKANTCSWLYLRREVGSQVLRGEKIVDGWLSCFLNSRRHPYLYTWKGLQVRKHIHAAYFC